MKKKIVGKAVGFLVLAGRMPGPIPGEPLSSGRGKIHCIRGEEARAFEDMWRLHHGAGARRQAGRQSLPGMLNDRLVRVSLYQEGDVSLIAPYGRRPWQGEL